MAETALVVGLGVSGLAVASHLLERGGRVVAMDDAPGERARAGAAALGIQLVEAPDGERLGALVAGADVVVPSPGVPMGHPVFRAAAAAGVPVRGEVELAYRWTRRPLVAVTGTNGKTTVTVLVTEMLRASGIEAVAGGNIGLPLSEAVRRDVAVVVAEVSSFQLWWTDTFRPAVAVWLNVAEDHLDWHPDMASYLAAKARIWAHQGDDDLAVVNAEDPAVADQARAAPGRVETFGISAGDWRVAGGVLTGPAGDLVAVADMRRALPHDLANALAASAAAMAMGATRDGVAATLGRFDGLAHRLTLVAEVGGVRWYDDSKATNPHAALAAVEGFPSVVLVAGGRNKGLDLAPLRRSADRIRAVVAMGEAGPDVEAVFAGVRPVVRVDSMEAAVGAAAAAARPGDVVLLAPACASFDGYRDYAERGDDFASHVARLTATQSRRTVP